MPSYLPASGASRGAGSGGGVAAGRSLDRITLGTGGRHPRHLPHDDDEEGPGRGGTHVAVVDDDDDEEDPLAPVRPHVPARGGGRGARADDPRATKDDDEDDDGDDDDVLAPRGDPSRARPTSAAVSRPTEAHVRARPQSASRVRPSTGPSALGMTLHSGPAAEPAAAPSPAVTAAAAPSSAPPGPEPGATPPVTGWRGAVLGGSAGGVVVSGSATAGAMRPSSASRQRGAVVVHGGDTVPATTAVPSGLAATAPLFPQRGPSMVTGVAPSVPQSATATGASADSSGGPTSFLDRLAANRATAISSVTASVRHRSSSGAQAPGAVGAATAAAGSARTGPVAAQGLDSSASPTLLTRPSYGVPFSSTSGGSASQNATATSAPSWGVMNRAAATGTVGFGSPTSAPVRASAAALPQQLLGAGQLTSSTSATGGAVVAAGSDSSSGLHSSLHAHGSGGVHSPPGFTGGSMLSSRGAHGPSGAGSAVTSALSASSASASSTGSGQQPLSGSVSAATVVGFGLGGVVGAHGAGMARGLA